MHPFGLYWMRVRYTDFYRLRTSEMMNWESELYFLRLLLTHEAYWDPQESQGNLHVMVHHCSKQAPKHRHKPCTKSTFGGGRSVLANEISKNKSFWRDECLMLTVLSRQTSLCFAKLPREKGQ